LVLQTNGTTTAVTISTGQVVTLAQPLPVASGGSGVITSTGTGSVVLGTSPTLTTPTISSLSSASATALTLQSAGTTAITVDTSQNVGIGTSSPAYKVDVQGTVARVGGSTAGSATAYTQYGSSATDLNNYLIGVETGSFAFYQGKSGGTTTERMRIDSSGNLLVGTTSVLGKIVMSWASASQQGLVLISQDATFSGSPIVFDNNAGGVSGFVGQTTSTVSYNTSSDYRLKNTIAPMTGALTRVALLKPCTYKWNVDGSDGQGFIAHELQEVVEGCVTGEKDATREEEYEVTPAVPAVLDAEGVETTPAVQAVKGTRTVPLYQGVDTSFLVATLTAAIQELKAIIDTQAERITALEVK
jgi:hypothetical protein